MSKWIDLHIHRKLSLFSGFCYPMPENYENRSRYFRFFWSLYVVVPYGFMIAEIMSHVVLLTFYKNNIEALTTSLLASSYLIHFLLKLIVFRLNRETFVKIFENMIAISRELMQNPFGDETFPKFFDKFYLTVVTFAVAKCSLQMMCNIGLDFYFCILSWIGETPKITTAYTWAPFDNTKDPGYTITVFFEMVAFCSVTFRTAVHDLMFWILVLVPSVQLDYLKYLMGHMLNDLEDDDVKAIGGSVILNPKNVISETVLYSELEWWTKIHQRILGMVHDLETLASPFLAVSFVAGLINLFMSGFVGMSSTDSNVFQSILINTIILTNTLQLYIFAICGDWLRESSEKVADLGFSGLLFKLKLGIRRHFLFILTRTRQEIKLRFGGIYPLSSQTFLALIQVTLTYFITLIQLRHLQERTEQASQSISN